MSKIAGEINAEMLKNNKVIHDKRRILFAEMVKQTGSQQSVLDCLLQEIESLRQKLVTITNKLENASATADAFQNVIQQADEDIGILRRQRDELLTDAERYRWLRIHGLQRAWVSLGTDCDGENFADFKCEFKVPEPPNLPYEDDEGLEWADKDFDAAIDAAISTSKVKP